MRPFSGQPNHAPSPAPEMPAWTAGLITSDAIHHVNNRFQPAGGGSFFARRATTDDQSIACRSTLKPIWLSSSRVTSAAPWVSAMSVGSSTMTGRPSYPDSFTSALAFSRSGLPGAPAADSNGPPHVNSAGQGL